MATSGVGGISSPLVFNISSGNSFTINCQADSSPVVHLFLLAGSSITTSLGFTNLPNASRGILKIENISGGVRNISIPTGSGTVTPSLSNIANNGIRVIEFLVVNGLFSWQLWS